MKELDGELRWEDVDEIDYDYENEDSSSESSSSMSGESPESCHGPEEEDRDQEDQEDQEDLELQDFFSARRATKLLLSKYPDAFSYDPKSMRLDQFLAPESGLTEFGWL